MVLLTLLLSFVGFAGDLRGFLTLSNPESAILVMENQEKEPATLDLQFRDFNGEFQSVRLSLSAMELRQISIVELCPMSTWLHFQSSAAVEVKIKYPSHKVASVNDYGSEVEYQAQAASQLFLTNLSPFENRLELVVQGEIDFITLAPFRGKSIDVFAGQTVKIRGSFGFLSEFSDSLGVQEAQLHKPKAQDLNYKAYFELSSLVGDESFIVALNDPQLIAEARNMLAGATPTPKILIAEIGPQQEGFNRNLRSSSHSLWSWQPTRVLGFADFASIKCDGTPLFVELLLKEWTQSKTRICFWNFHVVKEIRAEEL